MFQSILPQKITFGFNNHHNYLVMECIECKDQCWARSAKETHCFDTTELYLNLIQVHCLYRVYLQELKSWKGSK